MDQTIALLEREQIQLIPVLNFGFIYRNDNSQAQKFLTWILSEGQQYNKTYGFLPVEDKILAAQLKEIDNVSIHSQYKLMDKRSQEPIAVDEGALTSKKLRI